MNQQVEIVTFHCLEEYNEWEGESWYHYFLDEPGVWEVLNGLVTERTEEDLDNDYPDLTTVNMTWEEATRLTNLDIGKVGSVEELRNAPEERLYKGGIRDFGKKLFTWDLEGPAIYRRLKEI